MTVHPRPTASGKVFASNQPCPNTIVFTLPEFDLPLSPTNSEIWAPHLCSLSRRRSTFRGGLDDCVVSDFPSFPLPSTPSPAPDRGGRQQQTRAVLGPRVPLPPHRLAHCPPPGGDPRRGPRPRVRTRPPEPVVLPGRLPHNSY